MTVIFATLGYSAEKVTYSIRHEPEVERVVAFVGSRENRQTERALTTLRGSCEGLDLELDAREIGSAYDFVGAVRAYLVALDGVKPPSTVLFNISGGTGVMQAAAAFLCFARDLPAVYFNVEEERYARLPRLMLAPSVRPSPQQMRVLRALIENAEGLRPGDLAKRARLSDSTLDYHLRKLEAARLVRSELGPDSRRRRLAATDLARLIVS